MIPQNHFQFSQARHEDNTNDNNYNGIQKRKNGKCVWIVHRNWNNKRDDCKSGYDSFRKQARCVDVAHSCAFNVYLCLCVCIVRKNPIFIAVAHRQIVICNEK